ncbi:MAG: SRPBCC family protein [Deltaproteobacteria bacterium]|nr:MAG: SRPBCC family protein [Deltaproteobacteria bacterium]
MAIGFRQTFQVEAPIDAVWRFLLDPQQVATCMPGAELDEVVDDRTFLGGVQVKVGAITTRYKGRVRLTEVDEQGYAVEMVAEGRETGGGTAKGTLSGRLRSLSDGQTEVVAEATVDLTGRVMQVGRGMIDGVSNQLFQQFVTHTKARLEAPSSAAAAELAARGAGPIRVLPLILQAIWSAIVRFLRRLFRRPATP